MILSTIFRSKGVASTLTGLTSGMPVQQYAQQYPNNRNQRLGYDNILSRYKSQITKAEHQRILRRGEQHLQQQQRQVRNRARCNDLPCYRSYLSEIQQHS
jgi:hypothetical protein